ncbi:MAG: phosphoadenosine phosphosulfate reductase family protein [Methylobacter sp.]|jgi:3'-phosphoadenosine 5'-phosphosulfate sulfotransferase (PAPS reductase)/FAD synthetase|nr:phosphoadenosine phosphosulfate reductase family protein [Methylobacter sp.]
MSQFSLPDLSIGGVDLLRSANTQNVLSFSGGKDSVAMYLLAMENDIDFLPVCADTGNEHEITMDYVRDFHRHTGGPEVRIIKADFSGDFAHRRMFIANDRRVKKQRVVKRNEDGSIKNGSVKPVRFTNKQKRRMLENLHPSGNPFLDLMMIKGRFASTKAAFCTERLKRDPIIEQVYFPFIDAGKIVVSWQGVRAEESPRRAKYPIYDSPGGGVWNYRPIHQLTSTDVFSIAKRHGIEPNPLYKMGMGRVGCMPCVNCKKDELSEIALRFPEHIERIAEWEWIVSLCGRNNNATFFHASKTGGSITGINGVAEWSRTGKGGRTFDLFKDTADSASCSSAYGLCD